MQKINFSWFDCKILRMHVGICATQEMWQHVLIRKQLLRKDCLIMVIINGSKTLEETSSHTHQMCSFKQVPYLTLSHTPFKLMPWLDLDLGNTDRKISGLVLLILTNIRRHFHLFLPVMQIHLSLLSHQKSKYKYANIWANINAHTGWVGFSLQTKMCCHNFCMYCRKCHHSLLCKLCKSLLLSDATVAVQKLH